MVGGTHPENREPIKIVESFDFITNQWTIWPNELNIAREGPGVLQIDEKTIYVIGGRGADCQGTIEVWNSSDDPNTDGWRIIPDLNVKHQNQEYVVTLLESEC